MKNLKSRSYKAFAWDLGGKLVDQGVAFFISVILARLLAPEEFGLLAMAAVVIALAQVLIESGLGVSLIQKQDITDRHYASVYFFNITIGLFLTVLFFFLSGVISEFYERPELKLIMRVLSFVFLINSFARVKSAWLIKQLKLGIITKARVLSVLVGGGAGIIFALIGFGVWALVIQSLLTGIVLNTYIILSVKWKPKYEFDFSALRELWGFGFRMFLSEILHTIALQLDNLIIGKVFAPATLGYYHRAKTLNEFINKYTSSSLMSILFPTLSSVQNDEERYKHVTYTAYNTLNFLVFALVGVLFVTAEDIIVVVFSDKWINSVEYFRIFLMGAYAIPLSTILVSVLSSRGNSKVFLRLEIVKQSLMVPVYIIGFGIGIDAFLYGLAIYYFLAVIINSYFASKEIKEKPFQFIFPVVLKIIKCVLIISLLSYLDKFIVVNGYFLHGLFWGVIFIFIYLGLCFITKDKGMEYVITQIKLLLNKAYGSKAN